MRSGGKVSVRLVKSGNLGNVSWPVIDVGIFSLLLTGYNKAHLCKKTVETSFKRPRVSYAMLRKWNSIYKGWMKYGVPIVNAEEKRRCCNDTAILITIHGRYANNDDVIQYSRHSHI